MINYHTLILEAARSLGFNYSEEHPYFIAEWLREEKLIHVEVGSIWNNLHNYVESYSYTISVPINIYYLQPVCASGGATYHEMFLQGIAEALSILNQYVAQQHLGVTDDEVVIAYLKGYGDKKRPGSKPNFRSNIENYAYSLGKMGDYIEEGRTEDDILELVRNSVPDDEMHQLK